MDFQDHLAWNGGFGGAKWGKRWCDVDPQQTRSYVLVFFRLCQFWWKSIKKCDRESAHRRTHTRTHGHRDTNRFFNLSHAICYSYGANNECSTFLHLPYTTEHQTAMQDSTAVLYNREKLSRSFTPDLTDNAMGKLGDVLRNQSLGLVQKKRNYYYYNHFMALCLGLPRWAGSRRINHSRFCWSRDSGVAVASAGPYASPDR